VSKEIKRLTNTQKMKKIPLFLLLLSFFACSQTPETNTSITKDQITNNQITNDQINTPYLTVLGIAQDGGFPHARCEKDCCKEVWDHLEKRKMVSCLALVDPINQKSWMFDATPDFRDQWHILEHDLNTQLAGIFLTHAHIGHYTGLIHLGREVVSTDKIPVYAMPKMKEYLETNGPWSQLVKLQNIKLQPLQNNTEVFLDDQMKVVPLQVPHRDEYSETVGYQIHGPNKKVLFIPDINKWELWERSIVEEVKKVDYAFLDGSFFKNGEIPGRDMSEIPHPFIEESLQLFSGLSAEEKAKIYFIHFNHTNPVLQDNSPARLEIQAAGLNMANEGMKVEL
jgi:pyrroloquinoline quinone biosynthesis protein B